MFSLLEMIKFYVTIARQQTFSIIIINQSLGTKKTNFNIFDEIDIIIHKFRYHPSIVKLK